jgi:hypothetical protein
MERLTDVEVTDRSVKFAGDYIEKKFKKGRDTEKSLVLNCSAHGFFMGVRHVENVKNKPRWKFWVLTKWSDEELQLESIKAAKTYVREKGFKKLDIGTSALIRAVVGNGFINGVRYREQSST